MDHTLSHRLMTADTLVVIMLFMLGTSLSNRILCLLKLPLTDVVGNLRRIDTGMRQQRPLDTRKPALNEHRVGQYPNRDVSDPRTVGLRQAYPQITKDPLAQFIDDPIEVLNKARDIEKSCHYKHETRDREQYSVPSDCLQYEKAVLSQRVLRSLGSLVQWSYPQVPIVKY